MSLALVLCIITGTQCNLVKYLHVYGNYTYFFPADYAFLLMVTSF